jgi:uncharacterized membrane protein YphA (DoxX/SURF4 family)
MNEHACRSIYTPLRVTYGLVPFLAGLDKFFNVLTDWPKYVSSIVPNVLGLAPQTLMHLVGPIEMAVGILVLTRWTRIGAYIAAIWLVLIAGNLIAAGYLDIAVRDLSMAVGAYSLGRLAVARQEQAFPGRMPSGSSVRA